VEHQRARWDAALTLYEEQLRIWREIGDDYRIARVLMVLGVAAYMQGDLARGRAAEHEAIAIFRTVGDRRREAFCLFHLAKFAAAERRWIEAARGFRESLCAFVEVRDASFVHDALVWLAAVAADFGRSDVAVRLLGATDEQLRCSGAQLLTLSHATHDRTEALCRQTLGEETFAAAHQVGRSLSQSEWVDLADEVVAAALDAAPPSSNHDALVVSELTNREVDVLLLVAEGRTDREIAKALFVSIRTVNVHVAHILSKLDVPNRRNAVSRARELGLLSEVDAPPRYT
jgi:DNA-binding CsgD family transcriptional regulator